MEYWPYLVTVCYSVTVSYLTKQLKLTGYLDTLLMFIYPRR